MGAASNGSRAPSGGPAAPSAAGPSVQSLSYRKRRGNCLTMPLLRVSAICRM